MRLELILVAVVVTGCTKNSNYCPGANPDNNCAEIDAPGPVIDAPPTGCGSDGDCSGATAVCDTGTRACVACTTTEPGACTGPAPVCKQDACAPCTSHSDCSSNVCLPDGSCGTDSNVAYVDPGGTDNTSCTKATPCTKVAKALATAKPFLKFVGTTDEAVTVNGGRVVTFLASPTAALTRSGGTGAIVSVSDAGTSLSIFDLAIKNAPNNSSGFGIVIPAAAGSPTISLNRATLSNNPAGGISVAGGTLSVMQSTISGNAGGGISASGGTGLVVTQSTISGNTAGGISISNTPFTILNNMIVENGGPTSFVGGINLVTVGASGAHQFDFNTIASNVGSSDVNSGVNCGTVLSAIVFDSNIVYGNVVSGAGRQIGGSANCSSAYSDVGPDTATGPGNINMDPMFVSAAQHNFHITSTSSCKDAANPVATLNSDFDGDTRPQGANRDIGADEYTP